MKSNREIETLLLVDDDNEDIYIFSEVLSQVKPGVMLTTANDGKEALDLLGQKKDAPDVIFLDLNMPRVNGMELLRLLKAESPLREIPVIIYTTSVSEADKREAFCRGAIGFFSKPTELQELRNKLTAILSAGTDRLESALDQLKLGTSSLHISA